MSKKPFTIMKEPVTTGKNFGGQKIKISVKCNSYESFRTYGYYIGYSSAEITNILLNLPREWSKTVNNE